LKDLKMVLEMEVQCSSKVEGNRNLLMVEELKGAARLAAAGEDWVDPLYYDQAEAAEYCFDSFWMLRGTLRRIARKFQI
jgi:hypothetical protein